MKGNKDNLKIGLPLLILPIWYLVYHNLQYIADRLVDQVFGLIKGSQLTEAVRF